MARDRPRDGWRTPETLQGAAIEGRKRRGDIMPRLRDFPADGAIARLGRRVVADAGCGGNARLAGPPGERDRMDVALRDQALEKQGDDRDGQGDGKTPPIAGREGAGMGNRAAAMLRAHRHQ